MSKTDERLDGFPAELEEMFYAEEVPPMRLDPATVVEGGRRRRTRRRVMVGAVAAAVAIGAGALGSASGLLFPGPTPPASSSAFGVESFAAVPVTAPERSGAGVTYRDAGSVEVEYRPDADDSEATVTVTYAGSQRTVRLDSASRFDGVAVGVSTDLVAAIVPRTAISITFSESSHADLKTLTRATLSGTEYAVVVAHTDLSGTGAVNPTAMWTDADGMHTTDGRSATATITEGTRPVGAYQLLSSSELGIAIGDEWSSRQSGGTGVVFSTLVTGADGDSRTVTVAAVLSDEALNVVVSTGIRQFTPTAVAPLTGTGASLLVFDIPRADWPTAVSALEWTEGTTAGSQGISQRSGADSGPGMDPGGVTSGSGNEVTSAP